MQDPTLYGPEQEQLKCPRCDSSNTKFCYYNNYNLCQPRHLCKNCKRYWTKGGALRNIPVGGGTRKNAKRSSSTTSSVSPSSTTTAPAATSSSSSPSTTIGPPAAFDQDRRLVEVNNNNNGSFSSLLGSNVGQYGTSLPQGLNPNTNGPNLQLCGFLNQGPRPTQDSGQTQGQNSGSNGWPDLATYTPGSTFQ